VCRGSSPLTYPAPIRSAGKSSVLLQLPDDLSRVSLAQIAPTRMTVVQCALNAFVTYTNRADTPACAVTIPFTDFPNGELTHG
jgi:hypothetical protein